MRRIVVGLAVASLPVAGCGQVPPQPGGAPGSGITGTVERHEAFASRLVPARTVDVWLPPGHATDTSRRYPVVYMQDGQNLFDPARAFGGIDWAIDETMTRLIAEGRVRPAIVVAIWNTGMGRFAEYMPQKAATGGAVSLGVPGGPTLAADQLTSDLYLRFIVEELKPFVDGRYRTAAGRSDTFVMGSSMGGLISAYAVSEYPEVFGGAACVSTHWPAGNGAVVDYLAAHLPDPATHRFYFDHGTVTLDERYEPFQRRMDAAMIRAGYVAGENWVTRRFDGAEHSEKAWRLRAAIPLEFLLGR